MDSEAVTSLLSLSLAAAPTPTLSLASLSLSTSPPTQAKPLAPKQSSATPAPDNATAPISIDSKQGSKKRGVDYRCESCNKVYRHPNCLNKHRWEHTKQWREASKFVLSKHQQVQLLEAATILSYMGSQASTSLPEDRSEWPSFLSGGSLPMCGPNGEEFEQPAVQPPKANFTVSSSVPSGGPRMHDYALGTAKSGPITVRPGLLAVPTPAPEHNSAAAAPSSATRSGGAYSYGASAAYLYPRSASSIIPPITPTEESGGWSLPSSALRSPPSLSLSSSRSRSGSGSSRSPPSRRGRTRGGDEDEQDLELEEEGDDGIRIAVEDNTEGDVETMDGIQVQVQEEVVMSKRSTSTGSTRRTPITSPPLLSSSIATRSSTRRATSSTRSTTASTTPVPINPPLSSSSGGPTRTRRVHSRNSSLASNDGMAIASSPYSLPLSTSPYVLGYASRRRLSVSRGMKREEIEVESEMGDGMLREEDEDDNIDEIQKGEVEQRWNGMEMDLDMDMD